MHYEIKTSETKHINEWGEKDIRVSRYPEFTFVLEEMQLVRKFLDKLYNEEPLTKSESLDCEELLEDVEFFLKQAAEELKSEDNI